MRTINNIFIWSYIICFFALIIGLIFPKLVIHWGNIRNRRMVLKCYGAGIVISLAMGMGTLPKGEVNPENIIPAMKQEIIELKNKKESIGQEIEVIKQENQTLEEQSNNLINTKQELENEVNQLKNQVDELESKKNEEVQIVVANKEEKDNNKETLGNKIVNKGKEIIGMGEVKKGEVLTSIRLEYDANLSNIFSSNNILDIYIDGEKVYSIHTSQDKAYQFYLSEGRHTIKLKVEGMFGDSESIKFEVSPEQNAFIFGVEKKWNNIDLWLEASYQSDFNNEFNDTK